MKLGNNIRAAPYIKMSVDGYTFLARVDTGADVSAIPCSFIGNFTPVEKVTIRLYDGTPRRVTVYKGEVTVAGKSLYLENVITSLDDRGLVGLDVLDHFAVLFESGKMLLEPID